MITLLTVFLVIPTGTASYVLDLKDTLNNGGIYRDVWSDGTYVYTACDDSGVRAYSFDGSDFTLLDTIDNGRNYMYIWGDGTYIYTGCEGDGIRAYSFDGSDFTLEDTQDDGGDYQGIWGDGTYIYVGCHGDGIRAYSFNGSDFTLLDTLDDGGAYYGVWGDGNYIYTACFADGIRAYSFDGTDLTLLDTLNNGGYYYGVWGDGTYIYVACSSNGIRAYSFDGSDLTYLDSKDNGGNYYGVWGDGAHIYTACDTSGIRAYSYDGSDFTLEDSIDNGGNYKSVWGDGNYTYTACYINGIRAYELVSPPEVSSEYPTDTSTEVSVDTNYLNVTLYDNDTADGSLSISIETVPDVGNYENNTASNNTIYSCPISGLIPDMNYTWYVNASDGSNDIHEIYWFLTESPDPCNISGPVPVNGSTNLNATTTTNFTVNISHYLGYAFNWTIECTDGSNASGIDDTNGTKQLNFTELFGGMNYTVYVNTSIVTEYGLVLENATYWFTVEMPAEINNGDFNWIYPVDNAIYCHANGLQTMKIDCNFSRFEYVNMSVLSNYTGSWLEFDYYNGTGGNLTIDQPDNMTYNSTFYWKINTTDPFGRYYESEVYSYDTYPNMSVVPNFNVGSVNYTDTDFVFTVTVPLTDNEYIAIVPDRVYGYHTDVKEGYPFRYRLFINDTQHYEKTYEGALLISWWVHYDNTIRNLTVYRDSEILSFIPNTNYSMMFWGDSHDGGGMFGCDPYFYQTQNETFNITIANELPIVVNCSPTGGEMDPDNVSLTPNLHLNFTDWNETQNITWYWSTDNASWSVFATNNSVNETSCPVIQTMDNATDTNTTYYIKVNLTDEYSGSNVHFFNFTTLNGEPSISLTSPANNSVNYTVTPAFTCAPSDPDNDPVTVQFYWSNHTLFYQTTTTDATSTVSFTDLLNYNGYNDHLHFETNYSWYVNVTDSWGDTNTSEIFTFTTENGNDLSISNEAPQNNTVVDLDMLEHITVSFDISNGWNDPLNVSLTFDGTVVKTWTNTTKTSFSYKVNKNIIPGNYTWNVSVEKVRYPDCNTSAYFTFVQPEVTYVDVVESPIFYMIFFFAVFVLLFVVSEWKDEALVGILSGFLLASISLTYWMHMGMLEGFSFSLIMGVLAIYIIVRNLGGALDMVFGN